MRGASLETALEPSRRRGLYIYDITQTQSQGACDFNDVAEPLTTYKQTGFVHLTNVPYAAAFKP
jgi:hypothetical protein